MINLSQFKIEVYNLSKFLLGEKYIRRKYLSYSVNKYLKSDCIFIHIPKAAGTTIANAVIGERAGHFTASEVSDFMGKDKFREMFSFSITRDPFEKLLSAFEYIKAGGGEHGGVKHESYFTDSAFRSFDSFVQEWLVNQDLERTNILFKPQYMFVCDEHKNQIVNHIGKVEDLISLENILSNQLSREIRFLDYNRNTKRMKRSNEVSKETKALIQDLYSIDYSMFKY